MGWRVEAKRAIKHYPVLLQKDREIHAGSVTPNYSGMPSAHSASRTTELIALKQLPPYEQKQLDAVRGALEAIKLQYPATFDIRQGLIEALYWKRTHTIEGAALKLHIAESTARLYDRQFTERVSTLLQIKSI